MMLYWKANFQIPNSGTQAAEVYVTATQTEKTVTASFYADKLNQNLLFVKEIETEENLENIYDFLLTLNDFSEYTKVK